MATIGEMTLEDAALEAACNWRTWTCFVWDRKPEIGDPENWSIVYTHNRDSGLLDQSNAEVIAKAMKPFAAANDPDVVFESHSHWAVGHVTGSASGSTVTARLPTRSAPTTTSRSGWLNTPFSTRTTTPSENMMRPSTTSSTPPGG